MHIRCSGLARPMVCAGFVFLQNLPEMGDTDATKEGTAAGEYLERMLTKQPLGNVATNGVYFNDDMKFYLTPIYQDIMSRSSTPIMCEHEIDWQTRSGVWIKGHPDIAFVDLDGNLCIEDLKYGWGIVEVEENWQLLGYAIGEVIRRGQAFNEIRLTIHQPRPHHEDGPSRQWYISYGQLLDYKEKIEKRMDDLTDGKKEFQTSNQCKYCPGAGEACTAFNRLFYRALEVSTEFYQDSITEDELSRQLDQIKRAEEVIKIKKDSLTELGVLRVKQGKIIPGYIQEKSYGNRTWRDGVSPESIRMMTGKNAIQESFMTPAKVEKLGVPRELINQLSEKQFKGNKLVKKDATEIGNKIFGTNNPNGGK